MLLGRLKRWADCQSIVGLQNALLLYQSRLQLTNTFYGVYLSQTSEVMRLYEYMKELGLNRMYHLLISAHVINWDIEAAMDALTPPWNLSTCL
jgi:hypothetical protein